MGRLHANRNERIRADKFVSARMREQIHAFGYIAEKYVEDGMRKKYIVKRK